MFFTCFTKLKYIIALVVGSNDISKNVWENLMMYVRDILEEIQCTSSSVFELCKDLTIDFTEELHNISTVTGIVVESCSDNLESTVHKGLRIRMSISSKN